MGLIRHSMEALIKYFTSKGEVGSGGEGGGGVGSFDGGAISSIGALSSKYGNPTILLRSKPNLGFHLFYFTLYLFFF